MQKVHKSQTQTQNPHQLVKEVVLSDKCCFIDRNPRWWFNWECVSPFTSVLSSKSASLTKEIGCMTLREQTLFSYHFDPYSHVFSIPFTLFAAESPQTSPEMVLLGELVQERC